MAPPSPSWSDIPLELAGLVLRRLPAHADRVRFAAVCLQWRAAAWEFPLPWPLLALPDGTVYSLPGSEPLRLPSCIGYADASGNWVAFKTEDGCFLRDPFSNATVTLPQRFRFRAPRHPGGSEAQVSWVDMEDASEKTMCKLVFCSRQLIAKFIRFQNSTRVAVCQPGATWWSVHMDCHFSQYDDMTFHQGKLYILNGVTCSLFAIDVSVDDRTGDPWVFQVRQVVRGFMIHFPPIMGIYQSVAQWMLYLVELESHGVLLMVHRRTYHKVRIVPRGLVVGNFIAPRTIEFEVFMADLQQSKWTKVTTIGDDQVLFLRRRCSRFVRVSPEMPGDRIVFLGKDDWYNEGGSASDSCKVYDMRDGTILPFVPSVHWERSSVPATWLFPQV